MVKSQDQALEEAIGWQIRLHRADSADWERFTEWLEADPAHLAAYEEVAAADEAAARLIETKQPPVTSFGQPRRTPDFNRRAVVGLAIAAAIAGIIGFTALDETQKPQILETGAGERRMIALEDGTRIHLNGATRIIIDGEERRQLKLERGEALFAVVHDPANPFRVEAGSAVVQNLGTVFNVVHEGDRVVAAVAEGLVQFSAGGAVVRLAPGMTARQEGERIAITRGDAAEVGAWQNGQLSYSSASLAEIALDLSRNTGLNLKVSPELAGRRFSGVIVLDSDHQQLLRRVSALLEADVRPSGEGWILTPSDG